MYTCKDMEHVVATHSRFLANAHFGAPLNQYIAIQDPMLTATPLATMFVHARTGTLDFFVDYVEALMSSEWDIYISYYANDPITSTARITQSCKAHTVHPRSTPFALSRRSPAEGVDRVQDLPSHGPWPLSGNNISRRSKSLTADREHHLVARTIQAA